MKPSTLKMRAYNLMPPWGLECDSGWHLLILEMFAEMKDEINKSNLKDFGISQLKEKFGGLRVYTYGGNEAIENIIDKYAKKAERTCEICGKRGKRRVVSGWWKTVCRKHYREWKTKR